VEYAIEKPSNKLLALTDLDSNTWVSEVKRIPGKKQPLTAAGVHALRGEYTRTIAPARALAAETLTLGRALSDLSSLGMTQIAASASLTMKSLASSASAASHSWIASRVLPWEWQPHNAGQLTDTPPSISIKVSLSLMVQC
jgi:hypothetical protein